MSFTSFNFLAFLVAVVIVYYLVPKKIQWLVLLLASYGFYVSTGWDNLYYIIFTTLFTYGAGMWMQKIRDKNREDILALGEDATKEQKRELKKSIAGKVHTIQVVTALINLGVLIVVMCADNVVMGLNNMFAMFQGCFHSYGQHHCSPGPVLLYLQLHRLPDRRGPRQA